MSVPRRAKMADLINYRLRVVTIDGRQLTGQMLAFDKHMNLVLSETQEFRITNKTKKTSNPVEETRTLGLVILRGETIVSVSVESGPPPDAVNQRLGQQQQSKIQPGPGTARAINRGTSANAGLQGPVRQAPAGFGAQQSASRPPAGFQPPPGFR